MEVDATHNMCPTFKQYTGVLLRQMGLRPYHFWGV